MRQFITNGKAHDFAEPYLQQLKCVECGRYVSYFPDLGFYQIDAMGAHMDEHHPEWTESKCHANT